MCQLSQLNKFVNLGLNQKFNLTMEYYSQPLAKLDARPILRHEIYIILEPKKLNLGKRNIFKGHVDLCLRGEDGDWLVRGGEGRRKVEEEEEEGATRREAAPPLPATTWAATKLSNPISQLNFIQSYYAVAGVVLFLTGRFLYWVLGHPEGPGNPIVSMFQPPVELEPLSEWGPSPPSFGQVTLHHKTK